jgi:hypothetical protein
MLSAGVEVESWHRQYVECPRRNKTLLVLLGRGGEVTKLESIADSDRTSLRKYEVANGISFPAFNVLPLFQASTNDAKRWIDELKTEISLPDRIDQARLEKLVADVSLVCDPLWGESEKEKYNSCLVRHPATLKRILGSVPDEFGSIDELIQRAARLNAVALQEHIRQIALRGIAESPQTAKDWVNNLLVSSARILPKVSLVLELADWAGSFPYPANHKRVQAWINSRLMASGSSETRNDSGLKVDAFGLRFGEADSHEKYPEVRLAKLGGVKLRAMSDEIPCQSRYGRIGSLSFPAGKSIRQAMKDSLEWIGSPERQGRTWQDVSGACGFTKREGRKVPIPGILLAYPSVLTRDPPELATAFGGEEASDPQGVRFEKCAERVTAALNLAVRRQPETEIRVFVLTKVDRARTKVLFSRRYDAELVVTAARTWREGCNNIPDIRLNLGNHQTPWWITPEIPFPADIAKCLSVAWLGGGTRQDTVHGIGVEAGISLFMGSGGGDHMTAERALRLAIVNSAPLLLAIGQADHRRDGAFKLEQRYQRHPSLLPSMLGLLLYKLGHVKGDYMNSAPFLVGRMLALADTLHKEYCLHIRKGEVPPQLIGNALMSVALDNPVAGLARLSQRIAHYQAWANTFSGDEAGLAKWTLRQLGETACALGKHAIPQRCSDAEKAQMLLGYLARLDSVHPEREAN